MSKISGEESWISLGPWGGDGGDNFIFKHDGPIMEIIVWHGQYEPCISSILFQSKSSDGGILSSVEIGKNKSGNPEEFRIINSEEQISSINLAYKEYKVDKKGDKKGDKVLTFLSFTTNRRPQSFRRPQGDHFVSIPIQVGVIAGFFGRSGTYIDAIGIFIAPKIDSFPYPVMDDVGDLHSIQDLNSAPTQLKGMISDHEGHISIGPWGGKDDGLSWSYNADGRIMQITICYGLAINSISAVSKSCDGVVEGSSMEVGGTCGYETQTFNIDTAEEELLSISLTYDEFYGKQTIKSLCFITNLKQHGPFGSRTGASSVSMSIPIKGAVLRGLHGRVGTRLFAFGISVAPKVIISSQSVQEPDPAPTKLKVSNGATTNEVDYRDTGGPSSSSEMIHKDLQLLDSALQNYKTHMDKQIKEARQKLEMLQRSENRESDFEKLGHEIGELKLQILRLGSKGSEFDELRKAIEKLIMKLQKIRSATNENDHQSGDLSPTCKLIRGDLSLLDTALKEAESVDQMTVEIESAKEKFRELCERSSNSESEKKGAVRTAIAELKVKIRPHSKIRSADSNPPQMNWDNINRAEDGTTHFFHEERVDQGISSTDSAVLAAFNKLSVPHRRCLLCFFKFPPEASIKKTPMLYLWIGQGYISRPEYWFSSAWDVQSFADKIFDELIEEHLIKPIYQKCSLEPDSYMMEPSVRSSLYEQAKLGGFTSNGNIDLDEASLRDLSGTVKEEEYPSGKSCLVNVGQAIISCKPEVFEKHIQSLYLGRWQSLAKHHIEVPDVKILHGLKKLNTITFLSLQGISMITELPTFISELSKLMILDLRACHNLEMIPDNIGMLKRLTHLDMSECYLLERMPESLAELSNLQVLKGFLIEDFKNKKSSCTLSSLSRLWMLRKLNIYIRGKNIKGLQDLKFLEQFEVLEKLTISWGGCTGIIEGTVDDATLPPNLQKLDLQCFPMITLPSCLIDLQLVKLKKLYITGGKISYLDQLRVENPWKTVKLLKLKYLNELEIDWSELRELFPDLIYLRQFKCPRLTNFPCDVRGIWTNEEASTLKKS